MAEPTLPGPTFPLPGHTTSGAVQSISPHNPQHRSHDAAEQQNLLKRIRLKLLVFLGYAGPSRRSQRDRRELVKLVVGLLFALTQAIIIIVLTAIGSITTRAIHDADNFSAGQSELSACTSLGALNLTWLALLLVKCYLECWSFYYRRRIRKARHTRISALAPPSSLVHAGNVVPPDTHSAIESYRERIVVPIHPLTWTSFHALLCKLQPLVTVVWFFTAVFIVYVHGSHCRVFARHISAATYTVLIVLYAHFLMTTVIPSVRLAMERRRAGPPRVEKLSQSEVDRIPLVLYIPSPSFDMPSSPIMITPISRSLSRPTPDPLPSPALPSRRRRFIFFRPKRHAVQFGSEDIERSLNIGSPIDPGHHWDRTLEPAPYPFVRLPDNRTTCMICLAEFEAPRRTTGLERISDVADEGEDGYKNAEAFEMSQVPPIPFNREGEVEEVVAQPPAPADVHETQRAVVGGATNLEPLRLLPCGHVYHKDCVDPWLTQKSGRCPYCQARVELPPLPVRRRSGWLRGRS